MKKTNLIVLLALVVVLCLSFAACTVEKVDNSISGLTDITATCGDTVPEINATALYGEVSYGLAKADGNTAKESLTYGEYTGKLTNGLYYVKATVAEGEEYKAAEAYATITVNHQAFEAIDGEATFVAPVFDTQTKGYYKKTCACGEDIKGSDEYVVSRVTIDGIALADQVVVVGGKLTVPTDLPQAREGYSIAFLNNGQQFDFATHTVSDFETVALTTRECAVETRSGKYSNKNSGEWMFIEGAASYITDETISIFTQKDGYVEIQTNFLPDNTTASMQLSLGSAVVDAYHTYKFTFKATQGTFVWFGDNFENAKFTYTDDMAKEATVVEVLLTCVDGNLVGNFNGQELNFGKLANLNATILHFQDKDEELFANRGKRYTITVTDMVATYDYMSEAQSLLATIPTDVADVTVDNAFSLDEKIELFDAIATNYFSADEVANVIIAAEVRAKVNEIVTDPLIYLNNIIKDLPDFDNGKVITSANEAQLYQTIVDYVAYAKTMLSDEQLATYTEPKNVSLYRYYFFKNRDSAVVDVLNKIGVSGGEFSSNMAVMNNGGTMTLPAINFDLYQDITLGIKINPSAGEAVSSVAYNGKAASATTTSGSNWAQFHARKVDGVWYAQMSGPQVFDKAKAVELPADVISGKKGVEINFACGENATISVLFDVAYDAAGDGTQKAVANVMVGKLVQPDVNVYVVNYSYKTASGADEKETQYYIEGEQLVLPQAPAEYVDHHTYKLDGWFADETEYKGGETLSADLEIAAKYSVKTYETHTINFYLSADAAETYATKTINYGDKLVLPEDPAKTDPTGAKRYKFVGWATADGTIVTAETVVEDDMELTAVFVELKQVAVTYTNLNGEDIVDNTHFTGDKLVRPEDPAREGFAFMGWYTTAGEEYLFDSFLEENGLTLVAKWYIESKVKSVLYTAEQMKNIVKLNWGTLTAASDSKSYLFDTDGETVNDNFANLLKVGNEGLAQTWSLPAMNYNLYEKVEFVMSKGGLSVAVAGQDVDLSSGTEKNHFLFQIKDGKLNVYGINSYGKAIVSYNLPQAVINGAEPLTFEMKMETSGEMRISEVHATTKYVDYVSEAATLDAELVEWCNTNAANVSEMTEEQKTTFASKLADLKAVRNNMTTYESNLNKISDVITKVESELAK